MGRRREWGVKASGEGFAIFGFTGSWDVLMVGIRFPDC